MDAIRNPYAPGAGTQPPELAGRDALRETVRVALARIREGRAAKSVIMVGLRGVGKTVLLSSLRNAADDAGLHTIWMEVPENRSLPSILAPQLRLALLRFSSIENAKDIAMRGLRALVGFAKALKVKYNDIEIGFDAEAELGLADNGDLEHDLSELLLLVGMAARTAGTAVVMFIDELQYIEEQQLAALISALHRVAQRSMPVTLVGAGLPQLPGRMGNAKSYAERLFDIQSIGPLTDEAARLAIVRPAEHEGVVYTDEAVDIILTETQGYPYFLQEWGKHAWDAADASPIEISDVRKASITAVASLDESFFRIRFDRLTPLEKRYLRAMAELGPGPHRSGDIAEQLGKGVTMLGPTRSQLIRKGMIWSPGHGDTAFTVPMFDQYMKRIMPGNEWR